jgi:hypothetical protein
MINTNSYICEIQDINHVAYLTSVKGYQINEIRRGTDSKTGKEIMTFVFYDNHNLINADLAEYFSGDCSKFIQARNGLLSLIRQSKSITREEFLDKANGNG